MISLHSKKLPEVLRGDLHDLQSLGGCIHIHVFLKSVISTITLELGGVLHGFGPPPNGPQLG